MSTSRDIEFRINEFIQHNCKIREIENEEIILFNEIKCYKFFHENKDIHYTYFEKYSSFDFLSSNEKAGRNVAVVLNNIEIVQSLPSPEAFWEWIESSKHPFSNYYGPYYKKQKPESFLLNHSLLKWNKFSTDNETSFNRKFVKLTPREEQKFKDIFTEKDAGVSCLMIDFYKLIFEFNKKGRIQAQDLFSLIGIYCLDNSKPFKKASNQIIKQYGIPYMKLCTQEFSFEECCEKGWDKKTIYFEQDLSYEPIRLKRKDRDNDNFEEINKKRRL